MRADGAKSDAADKYEQKVKEMAEVAVSGVTQFQKARFRRPDQRSDGQEVKADNDFINTAELVTKAEQALAQANLEYHQKLLQLVFEK